MKSEVTKVPPHSSQVFAVSAVLLIVTIALYGQVGGHQFVNFDDDVYVFDNPHVNTGLAKNNALWAFQIHGPSEWIPLTWLSHQVCWQMFEDGPTGHHLVNVALHATSVLLLFGLLLRMTALVWPGALVAGLFAVHPLHVESVAWVTERKDTLCGLFWMVTLWMYWFYARRNGLRAMGLVAVGCALALMAKPLAVTLPCSLLLLDYWPLGRLRLAQTLPMRPNGEALPTQSLGWLLLEKVPLLLLSAVSSYLTVLCQMDAGALTNRPLGERSGNAAIAYVSYLGSMIWPTRLTCFYPWRGYWSPGLVAAAVIFLSGVTVGVIRVRRRYPHLLVGWLWYLGILVPMIGIVGFGDYWRADRYTYIPMVGIYLMIAWGARDLLHHGRWSRYAVALFAALWLGLLMALTRHQVAYWRDNQPLYEHALAVTRNNYTAHNNLGNALYDQQRFEDAIAHYQQAIRIRPDYAEAHNSQGNSLQGLERLEEAVVCHQEALRLKPDSAKAHNNCGVALAKLGRSEEAMTHFQEALRIEPEYAKAHDNWGIALEGMGRFEEAVTHYQEALRIKPDFAEAHNNLGFALGKLGRVEEAVTCYAEALRIQPDNAEAHHNWGNTLGQQGRFEEAVTHYQAALRIQPDHAEAHYHWGNALKDLGRLQEAAAHWQQSLRINPDYAEAHNNLGVWCIQQGQFQQAVAHFQHAVRLNPDHTDAINKLRKAEALLQQKTGPAHP